MAWYLVRNSLKSDINIVHYLMHKQARNQPGTPEEKEFSEGFPNFTSIV